MKRLYFILTLPLIVPHLICYSFTKSRKMIDADAERHSFVVKKTDKKILRVAYLLIFQKEFRNLFYYRLGRWSVFLRYLPKRSTLYIKSSRPLCHMGKLVEGLSYNMDFLQL